MAALARPAWKEWITGDFGVEAALVDSLWAEVERVTAEERAASVQLLAQ